MDRTHAPGPTPDHPRVALEASCGALLALELACLHVAESGPAADLGTALTELRQAIEWLHTAIETLHAAVSRDDETLSLGFVLGAAD